MVQGVQVLQHCSPPLLLHHQPQSLYRIQGAAVLGEVSLHHPIVEEVPHPLGIVDAQVVHVDNSLTLDLPHHLMAEVPEGRCCVGTTHQHVVHQALLLADGCYHRDGGTSGGGHLQHHISANPSLPRHLPVVEGALVHIDNLLALLDEVRDLERHPPLLLQDLLVLHLLAAILVLWLPAGDLVLPVEVAEGGVVDLHSKDLLDLDRPLDQAERCPIFQGLGAQQVLLHLLIDSWVPPTLALAVDDLVVVLPPLPDDGEGGVHLDTCDAEDLLQGT